MTWSLYEVISEWEYISLLWIECGVCLFYRCFCGALCLRVPLKCKRLQRWARVISHMSPDVYPWTSWSYSPQRNRDSGGTPSTVWFIKNPRECIVIIMWHHHFTRVPLTLPLFLYCRGMSAKLRLVVQHGLNTLRAGEKHGLQPALLIHWAQHLTNAVNPPHLSFTPFCSHPHTHLTTGTYYDFKECSNELSTDFHKRIIRSICPAYEKLCEKNPRMHLVKFELNWFVFMWTGWKGELLLWSERVCLSLCTLLEGCASVTWENQKETEHSWASGTHVPTLPKSRHKGALTLFSLLIGLRG